MGAEQAAGLNRQHQVVTKAPGMCGDLHQRPGVEIIR